MCIRHQLLLYIYTGFWVYTSSIVVDLDITIGYRKCPIKGKAVNVEWLLVWEYGMHVRMTGPISVNTCVLAEHST